MKTIVLSTSYAGKPKDIVGSLVPEGFQVVMLNSVSQEELECKACLADYILASGNLKINQKVLEEAGNLKMVQRAGVGLDSLDLPALKEHGIPVYVNRGVNSDSVAEHTLMFMLAALRRLPDISSNTKNGIWKKQEQGVTTRELATQTVGIVGGGNIGRTVAKLLNGFGCRILYYDVYRLPEEEEQWLHMQYSDLDDLFRQSDIITLHCPITDDTRGFICAGNIAKMKDGVILVNTSRGKLIDEEDLLDALESGKIVYACLDVYCEEPLKNFTLVQHDHVICTPHIAGNTYDSFYRMIEYAMRNIALYGQGRLAEIEEYRLRF